MYIFYYYNNRLEIIIGIRLMGMEYTIILMEICYILFHYFISYRGKLRNLNFEG